MKQSILAVWAIVFCLPLYAQYEYNFVDDHEINSMNFYPSNYNPSQKVKQITFEETNLRTKKTNKYIKTYDNNGKLINYIHLSPKNDTIENGVMQYTSKGKLLFGQKFRRSKSTCTSQYTVNDKGNYTSWMKTNGKQKIRKYKTWIMNEKGDITESVEYTKDTTKYKYKWAYLYEQNGKLLQTILYDRKGKVKRIWSYQCNDEGEKLMKQPKTTQICQWKKTDSLFITYSWRTLDEKGKIQKHVNKYTSKDTLLTETSTYDEKDSLIHRSTYNKSFNHLICSTSYNNGKKTYEMSYTYENDKKTRYTFFNGKSVVMKIEYSYNQNDLMTEERHFNSKGKQYKTIKLSYKL